MASRSWFVISIGYASDLQRNAIHSAIKSHAPGWWHHLPDTWIVAGHNHKYWGDLVQPILATTPATALVLELPRNPEQRMFASRGPFDQSAKDWLWRSYYQHDPSAKS